VKTANIPYWRHNILAKATSHQDLGRYTTCNKMAHPQQMNQKIPVRIELWVLNLQGYTSSGGGDDEWHGCWVKWMEVIRGRHQSCNLELENLLSSTSKYWINAGDMCIHRWTDWWHSSALTVAVDYRPIMPICLRISIRDAFPHTVQTIPHSNTRGHIITDDLAPQKSGTL
jgi:hypothetical protein